MRKEYFIRDMYLNCFSLVCVVAPLLKADKIRNMHTTAGVGCHSAGHQLSALSHQKRKLLSVMHQKMHAQSVIDLAIHRADTVMLTSLRPYMQVSSFGIGHKLSCWNMNVITL
ncbi:hypothetical protein CEXT_727891 [Caerostris extrusa]|uniref:Uncharacterized protein n=1 Tax=Caerostris extrusa TaxID=172846 RepID=A0AAV4N2M3_CAEEX|nr:hypothetical protein CEXT_727891 [Caerostris extrusa]